MNRIIFTNIVFHAGDENVAKVLETLYNEYVVETDYFIGNGFPTDPVLSPEKWFYAILNGTL